jgi:hypothetical protein
MGKHQATNMTNMVYVDAISRCSTVLSLFGHLCLHAHKKNNKNISDNPKPLWSDRLKKISSRGKLIYKPYELTTIKPSETCSKATEPTDWGLVRSIHYRILVDVTVTPPEKSRSIRYI